MYHALVYRDGDWISFGLHVPGQWMEMFDSLRDNYGDDNVTYVFWGAFDKLGDACEVRERAETEVRFANRAHNEWRRGGLSGLRDERGRLNLIEAMTKLQSVR